MKRYSSFPAKVLSKMPLYVHTLAALFAEDYFIFRQRVKDRLINSAIFLAINLIIASSILQHFGMAKDFGVFMVGSLFASILLFEIYPLVASTVADIEGPRTISYYLVAPVPSVLILVKTMCSLAFQAIIVSVCMMPVAKLLLWNEFSFERVSFFSLSLLFIVSGLFSTALGLLIVSFIKHMGALSNVWTRFIFPLWMFGGFQFSWQALKETYPTLAYLVLLNPVMYTNEGFRAALLGQDQFLSLPLCIGVLAISTLLIGWWAIVRLKKRLDFV